MFPNVKAGQQYVIWKKASDMLLSIIFKRTSASNALIVDRAADQQAAVH